MKRKTLTEIKGFLLDIDGTFYMGDSLLPGAHSLLDYFNRKKLPFIFLTNNSSKSGLEYVQKLIRLGIAPQDARVFTSGDAVAKYIQEATRYRRIYLVGTKGLKKSFIDTEIKLVHQKPDVVVLGYDTSLTYTKLEKMCKLLVEGVPFIATHPDINCPTPYGFAPDIGSVLALIKASTGREPDLIIGKPNRIIADLAAEVLRLPVGQLGMIGDRLYTDIAMGKTAGLTTILVLTGEAKSTDLENSTYTPDYIFKDLRGLLNELSKE